MKKKKTKIGKIHSIEKIKNKKLKIIRLRKRKIIKDNNNRNSNKKQ